MKTLLVPLFSAAVMALTLSAPAAETEPIYGTNLMTAPERYEYHNRMRSAKTAEEREQIRAEHHARMVERAKARGVTLPDEPPRQGGGMGPGMREGMGSGDGMGGGMGGGTGGGMRGGQRR